MQQITFNEFVYPFLLKNLGATVGRVADNQEDTNKILEDICKAIQNADLESAFKYGIVDATSIKRRLHRIKIIIGNYTGPNSYDDVVKEWERCVQSNLNMTRKELLHSIDIRKGSKTVFDVMDEIPEYRKIGVDILIALERKYNIPPALYSVEQVRQIAHLRQEFDHSVVRKMNEQEFTSWLRRRQSEFNEMFDGREEKGCPVIGYGRYKLYWMFALAHPELIPEKQLKYISEQELINVIDRAVNDKDITYYGRYEKVFPLSDKKHDTKLFKDSLINIVLRVLIA